MTTLSVRHLWKEYGQQVVLENVNLEVKDNEFITLVGASGCGKTTFLRMLLGEEQPTRGSFLIDGAPLPDEPGPDRGIVFQRYSVFPHLTVLGNVLLGGIIGMGIDTATGASKRFVPNPVRVTLVRMPPVLPAN